MQWKCAIFDLNLEQCDVSGPDKPPAKDFYQELDEPVFEEKVQDGTKVYSECKYSRLIVIVLHPLFCVVTVRL